MQTGDDQSLAIRLLLGLNRVYARGFHQVLVSRESPIPRMGPLIVVGNHISSLDPLLIQAVINRPIAWMIAREFYEMPVFRRLFKRIHLIPVSRDGKDSTALRMAMRTLHAGRVLGVFPEGKISTSGQPLPFQTGVAMIAQRAGVPVVPVYQTGTTLGSTMPGALLLPHKISLKVGKVINFSDPEKQQFGLENSIKTLENAIFELRSY